MPPSGDPPARVRGALLARLSDHRLGTAASAIAFDLFLALVPVLALVGWSLGALGRSGQLAPIEAALSDGVPGPAADLARAQLHRLAHGDEGVAPLAVAALVWVASGGAHTALATVRAVAGAPRWSWVTTRALALVFVVVGLALVAASTLVLVVIETSARTGALGPASAAFGHAGNAIATLGAATAGVALLYRFAQGSGGGRNVWRGAAVAVAAFAATSVAFTWYATRLARYAAFYGGLAAVAMLLVWLWLSSFSLLLGAEINAAFAARDGRGG